MLEHNLKAEAPKLIKVLGKGKVPFRDKEPSNALTPIVVSRTSSSKLTDVILAHSWKALDPMVVKVVGKVMAPVKPEV